jgi:hypothetical protein
MALMDSFHMTKGTVMGSVPEAFIKRVFGIEIIKNMQSLRILYTTSLIELCGDYEI